MQREILFKAKRKDNNEWVYGNLVYLKVENKYYIVDFNTNVYSVDARYEYMTKDVDIIEIIPETVCQFTGLTDKNGMKIFENDILKCHYINAIKDIHIEQVVFFKGKFMAYGKFNDIEHWAPLYAGISKLETDKSAYMDEMEIIGNVWDSEDNDS